MSIGFQNIIQSIKCNGVTHLDLSGQLLSAKDAVELSEALKTNTSLKTLNVRDNHIGYHGAQAIASALRLNQTLESIDISNNGVGEKARITLMMLWDLSDKRLKAMAEQLGEKPRLKKKSATLSTFPSHELKTVIQQTLSTAHPELPEKISAQLSDCMHHEMTLINTRIEAHVEPVFQQLNLPNAVKDLVLTEMAQDDTAPLLPSFSQQLQEQHQTHDAIDLLIAILKNQRDELKNRIAHYIKPLCTSLISDEQQQKKVLNTMVHLLTWPFLFRTHYKITALNTMQSMRRCADYSVTEADEIISQTRTLYRYALHRDVFNLRFFKQKTHDVIETLKDYEKLPNHDNAKTTMMATHSSC